MNTVVKIVHEVDWPGQLGTNQFNGGGRWDSVRDALNKLYVGGPAIEFQFENKKEVSLVQATVSGHALKQDSKAAGWVYQTTARGTSLFVRKAKYKGK